MSTDTQRPLMNGAASGGSKTGATMEDLNSKLKKATYVAKFHGDELLADKHRVMTGLWTDIRDVVTPSNIAEIVKVGWTKFTTKKLDVRSL